MATAAIPYLVGGESITPARMNTLIGALDSKMNNLLGGRSFLLANKELGGGSVNGAFTVAGVPYAVCGRPFHFTAGVSVYARYTPGAVLKDVTVADPVAGGTANGVGVRPYNHAPIASAVASATPLAIDSENAVATLPAFSAGDYTDGLPVTGGVSLLDHSLEAHRESYTGNRNWCLETGLFVPEKRYRYALAEVFIEGVTEANLNLFALEDSKYRCFRVHNLQLVTATVTLPGGFSASLQPLECKSFRLNAAGTAFAASSYRYFFEYRDDDYRHFWFWNTSPSLAVGSAGVTTPTGSMQANNLSNPCIIYDFIQFLTDEVGTARHAAFHRDVHELCDMGSQYSNVFPAIQA